LSRGKDKLYEGMSQADLLREAIKGLPEEERKKLVEEAMGGVVEAQEVDSTAIGDGGSGVVAKE
jgi:hypothetical protein